jgi:purine-binding chemotaxis protein CheW
MLDLIETNDLWDEAEPEGNRANLRRLIAFTLDGKLYGIPITEVAEIREELPTTPLPPGRVPVWVLGLINLRGLVLPVLDLRRRFEPSQSASAGSSTAQLVIVKGPGYWVALRVDSVYGLVRLDPAAFRLPPGGTPDSEFIAQIALLDNQPLVELDIQRILQSTSPLENM